MKATLILMIFAASLPLTGWADYTVKGEPEIEFTGYKFTEKVAVSGTFKKVNWKFNKTGKDIPSLLKNATVRIDSYSIDAGKPARNKNIKAALFKNWGGRYIEVKVVDVDPENQLVKTKITVGEHKQDLYFQFSLSGEDALMTASMDLLQQAFLKAFKSLSKTCAPHHIGKDGVRKTWSSVDLKVRAKLEKSPSS